jgi:hypothetical protein
MFIGQLFDGNGYGNYRLSGRGKCKKHIESDIGNNSLVIAANAWTSATFDALLNSNSVYLSIHKLCGSPRMPFESFRGSQIISSGGLIISEQSFSADEHEFKDIVMFGQISEIGSLYRKLAMHTSFDERMRMSVVASEKYMRRFDPTRLFANAGIYKLVDALIELARTRKKLNFESKPSRIVPVQAIKQRRTTR